MSKIKHYRSSFLDKMRLTTDPLADAAVQAVYADENAVQLRELLRMISQNQDTLPANLPPALATYLQQSAQLPAWADAAKMERGARFFSQYGNDLLLMLGVLSLPYDYAAAKGAQVLYLSQRLYGDPGKRLAETGQYILDITAQGAFSPEGNAIRSAQKVRLLHAAIRYHIVRSGQWKEAEWEKPINQEDMAGTNLSIALLPIRGLRKLGLRIAHEDMLAYLHLWNVASYVMGVDERLLPDTAKEAYVLEKAIADRQHAPSEAGRSLTHALLRYIQQQSQPAVQHVAPLYMRFLLGERIASWLDIPEPALSGSPLLSITKNINRFRSLAAFSLPAAQPVSPPYRQAIRAINKDEKGLFGLPAGLLS